MHCPVEGRQCPAQTERQLDFEGGRGDALDPGPARFWGRAVCRCLADGAPRRAS